MFLSVSTVKSCLSIEWGMFYFLSIKYFMMITSYGIVILAEEADVC